ncbi:hypothetical protein KIPB_007924 [Kipferlia bialata]|uniref:Uncharacterized protein n=1 Tax=Kipferlia bialata TaxID=797122 RepID=A0A391NMV4_9EUKA|nr:hypothetical protein KIPB_007924 [Kipferlia bialata]|eukprot:g7924.t1
MTNELNPGPSDTETTRDENPQEDDDTPDDDDEPVWVPLTADSDRRDALIAAILLALTAPTEDAANEVSMMAEGLADGMSEEEVEECKAEALHRLHWVEV